MLAPLGLKKTETTATQAIYNQNLSPLTGAQKNSFELSVSHCKVYFLGKRASKKKIPRELYDYRGEKGQGRAFSVDGAGKADVQAFRLKSHSSIPSQVSYSSFSRNFNFAPVPRYRTPGMVWGYFGKTN